MARRRFIHVKGAKHGVTVVDTITSVTFTEQTNEIAGSGDDDKADSFLARGKSVVRGEINMDDPIQAQALKAVAAADFVFDGVPEAGATDRVRVTLKNVVFFTRRNTSPHDALWTGGLSFRCFMPDGTDPVTIGLTPNT
jgi:hypothetical protein